MVGVKSDASVERWRQERPVLARLLGRELALRGIGVRSRKLKGSIRVGGLLLAWPPASASSVGFYFLYLLVEALTLSVLVIIEAVSFSCFIVWRQLHDLVVEVENFDIFLLARIMLLREVSLKNLCKGWRFLSFPCFISAVGAPCCRQVLLTHNSTAARPCWMRLPG